MLIKIAHLKYIIVQLNEGVFLTHVEKVWGGKAFCFLCILVLPPCPDSENRAIQGTAPVLRLLAEWMCATLADSNNLHFALYLVFLKFIFAIQQNKIFIFYTYYKYILIFRRLLTVFTAPVFFHRNNLTSKFYVLLC